MEEGKIEDCSEWKERLTKEREKEIERWRKGIGKVEKD